MSEDDRRVGCNFAFKQACIFANGRVHYRQAPLGSCASPASFPHSCPNALRSEGVGLMLTYTLRRLLIAIPIFLGITVLLYILVSITPDGGPLAAYVGPGKHLTAQQFQA